MSLVDIGVEIPTVGLVHGVATMRATDEHGDPAEVRDAWRLIGWMQSARCLSETSTKMQHVGHHSTARAMFQSSMTVLSGMLAAARLAGLIDEAEAEKGVQEIAAYAKRMGLL